MNEFVHDIQDEVDLIRRLQLMRVAAPLDVPEEVPVESVAEIADSRPSDAGEKPVRNALVILKPQRKSRSKKT